MTDLSGYEARNAEREKLKENTSPIKLDSNAVVSDPRTIPDSYFDGRGKLTLKMAKGDFDFLVGALSDEVERDIRELIAMVKERDARIAELERGEVLPNINWGEEGT